MKNIEECKTLKELKDLYIEKLAIETQWNDKFDIINKQIATWTEMMGAHESNSPFMMGTQSPSYSVKLAIGEFITKGLIDEE